MKRFHIPGLIDVLKVDSANAINELANRPGIDRQFHNRRLPLNAWLIGGAVKLLSLGGRPFPAMRAFDAPGRAPEQQALWERLNALAPQLRDGPPELEALARWVAGNGDDEAVGPLAQQVIGRLFNPDFIATRESWNAALTIPAARAPGHALRKLWWSVTGRVTRAKTLLASMLNGDLAGVHGSAVAIHNVVKGLRDMRALHARSAGADLRATLAPDAVSRQCLHAPPVVLRQATASGHIDGRPYSPRTLILLELDAAYRDEGAASMVFLDQSWSRCPAEQWVPALLEGVWRRAR